MAASIVGRSGFARGDRVRVNFQVNDGTPPSNTVGYRIWFHNGSVCSPRVDCFIASASEPFCDPRCTGEVELR
jgi:hypothetical protein